MDGALDFHVKHAEHPTCVVSFASMGESGIPGGVPRFEWCATLDAIGCGQVRLRDPAWNWYRAGVAGIRGVPALADFINSLHARYDRVVTLGLSMGGYGALLYGMLAPVDLIIALSPQTNLDPDGEDERWREHWQIAKRCRLPWQDLQSIGCVDRVEEGIHIFVGLGGLERHALMDLQYGHRIERAKIVGLHGVAHADVGRALRDDGTIEALIRGKA